METMQWAFFNHTSRDMSRAITTIQQATTTYRPNQIIWNIVRKELELPFEARMSRPFYHMDRPHAFAETFYCSESYAMGSIQMTIVDNPNQQMVWSMVAKGKEGPTGVQWWTAPAREHVRAQPLYAGIAVKRCADLTYCSN